MRDKEILLVEDNEDDIFLTQRALQKAKIMNKILVARDGEQAIEYLYGNEANAQTNGDICPVLILLDLKMPRVDGLDLLREIRQNGKTCMCPVVILTSSTEEVDIIRGYKLGANSYIRKPVDFNQFVEAVSQLGLYWLVLNEPPYKLPSAN